MEIDTHLQIYAAGFGNLIPCTCRYCSYVLRFLLLSPPLTSFVGFSFLFWCWFCLIYLVIWLRWLWFIAFEFFRFWEFCRYYAIRRYEHIVLPQINLKLRLDSVVVSTIYQFYFESIKTFVARYLLCSPLNHWNVINVSKYPWISEQIAFIHSILSHGQTFNITKAQLRLNKTTTDPRRRLTLS